MREKELETLLEAAWPLIELAIDEDIGPGDATSDSTLDASSVLYGRIVAKAAGVIAGLPVAEAVFKQVDPTIKLVTHVSEGQPVVAGELIAEATGPARSLLAAERTVLNFLQRMSGVATLTKDFVDALATSGTTLLDTRKTLPGFRVLDKYAVRMGGGSNHRMSLYDMLLIKDNHIDGAGGVSAAVAQARQRHPELPIEVEVRTLDELREALKLEPLLDRILLDNMSIGMMRKAVTLAAGDVPLEASGNATLQRVPEIGASGVDYVSVGALTHSVQALDLSMKVIRPEQRDTLAAPDRRVREIKLTLGNRLTILGHHYQRDEVIELSDFRGDSLKLARYAAGTDAEFIVFCGVHFMAEAAAILTKPGQHVFMPDLTAGCYLADTATLDAVQAAWDALDAAYDDAESEITPITYVNSSAALKAFCGARGGIVCTSGNAPHVLQWALSRRPRVFFFPDQHLGRNTTKQLGIPLEEVVLWNTRYPPSTERIRKAKVVLWPGVCNVHQRFRPEHVQSVRARSPDIRVLVHPECSMEVVDLADDVGSTAHIIKQVEAAPAGTKWAIGTENRLVHRLQQQHSNKIIASLADVEPYCTTMSQTTLQNLSELLTALSQDRLVNEVKVAPDTTAEARIALERMLAIR